MGARAVAAPLPRGRARPLCAPAPAGPGVHDRRRRPAAAVRPDQDAAAARACLSRGHGGRDAPHPRARRGAGTRRAELSYESPRPGRRLVNDTRPLVLIADDEPQLREVLQRALERGGYRVLGAGSAESAYELLAAERVDAVLLDVHLPTMSGLALYLAILNRWPALAGRIAIMTGDAEAEEVRAWLERNPCTVLRKPFNLREIFEWLSTAAQLPTRGRANG